MKSELTKFANKIINIFFPPFCIVCDKYGMQLCDLCEPNLPRSDKKLSPWSHSLYSYQDKSVQKAIKSIKYNSNVELGINMGEKLGLDITQKLEAQKINKIVLIPIPLHKNRYKQRGYNQAEVISKGVLLSLGKIFNTKTFIVNLLSRKRETDNLYKKVGVSSRLDEIGGVMEISQKEKEKLNIFLNDNESTLDDVLFILIDDVTTTGATLYEAKNLLNKNAYKNVLSFTLAN